MLYLRICKIELRYQISTKSNCEISLLEKYHDKYYEEVFHVFCYRKENNPCYLQPITFQTCAETHHLHLRISQLDLGIQ